MEQVLGIAELWANIISFLHPRQIRRLRLVSKRVYNACVPHFRILFPIDSRTPAELIKGFDFPADMITAVQIEGIDQISPLIISVMERCIHLTLLRVHDIGLDVTFLEKLLQLCPLHLKRLYIRSEGFVSLESMLDIVLDSKVASELQTLGLEIGDTGLDETHSLPWKGFRSILDSCPALSTILLRRVKIMDVPVSLEEIDPMHAITMTFPNIEELALVQCDISSRGRVRLLRMFPNLKALHVACRDSVLEPSDDGVGACSRPGYEAGVTAEVGASLTRVKIECTNSRSQADQQGLYQFLGHLRNLKVLELSGLTISSRTLVGLADSWSQHGVRLKRLVLDLVRRKAIDDEGLELMLKQPCCSMLEGWDTWCGPDLLLRFWNWATMRSELPCLQYLRSLHLRKDEAVDDLQEGALQVLNFSLKQMPRLVDLTIAVRLEDFAIFEGMGRDPYSTGDASDSTTDFGLSVIEARELQERPFLQSLMIGCSAKLLNGGMGEIPRQIGRRFRVLEDFCFARAAVVLATAFVGLTSLTTTSAFYIPGLSPTVFRDGQRVPLYVNKIFSKKSPLPYAYADLPFVCSPPKDAKNAWLNLGEVLRGDRISTSDYELVVGQDIKCKALCKKHVSAEDAALARDFIINDYSVEWIVDNLPGATRYNLGDGQAIKQRRYRAGFALGKVKGSKSNIHNHVTIRILYQNLAGLSGGKLIVGFEVNPYSIGQGDSCPEDPLKIGPLQSVSDKEVDIQYTYSVQWIETKEVTWNNRWSLYLVSTDAQVHWYSIVNSIVIILFLTGLVAIVIMKTLKKDITIYNEEEMKDDLDDGAGWKLVHGDVFRTPRYSTLLCALLGTGVQILVMAISTILFALVGILNPSYRGGFVSFGLFLFVFAGVFAGYYSARLYKVFKGTSWTKNAILTATVVPGFMMTLVFMLNIFVWSKNSSNAIPFGTFFALAVMWFGISLPLSLIGAFFGQRKAAIEHPGRTNQIPRQIPEPVWYMRPRYTIMMGGLLPFAVIFIELFFILKSIWEDQYYYMFGILGLVFMILLVTCVEISIIVVYFQLCDEDYNWWWRSFFVSSFSAVYVFMYSMVYFMKQLSIDHFVPALSYFTNSLMICIVYGLLTGTTGFISTYWFVRKIYSAVKID
ncbi:Transmembrane 9 super member 4 [Mortierella sp. GBA30]|nr:Transmembrane 9 super member 4 [Mortierella sp. GBA30]